MTKFEGCYLTSAGLAMVYNGGLTNITFTKAVTGSGVYMSAEDIHDMTELKEQQQEFGLDSFSEGEDCTVDVTFKINNTGLREGYQLSEIGIYAKSVDGEEKLYCVGYAVDGHTEEVPAHDGSITYYMAVTIETVVSRNANVSIIYSEEREWMKNYVDGIVGDVDVKGKGDLQTQIDRILGDNPDGGGMGFVEGLDAKNMIDAINKVFIFGNEAKNKLVDNLVAMGVEASTDDTIGQLIDKILEMTNTSEDTVTAAVLLDGYTAHNAAGEQITGIMPELAGVTVDATGTTQDSDYTYFEMPAGHYDENSKVRSANSNLGSVYYLGTGTSFNVSSKFPNDYQKFTSANFIVSVSGISNGGTDFFRYNEDVRMLAGSSGISKNYNPSTGILTISGISYTAYHDRRGIGNVQGFGVSCTVSAYLVTGSIK